MSCSDDMTIVQREGTVGRLKRACCVLAQFVVAYDHGYQMLLDEEPAPRGRDYRAGEQKSGKPESQAPKGRDRALQIALNLAGQKLGEALTMLDVWEWPDEPTWRQPNGSGEPDDMLTVPLNPEIVAAPVQQLRARLAGLQTADWRIIDRRALKRDDDGELVNPSEARDRDAVMKACSRIDSAAGSLKRVGVWEQPKFRRECGNCFAPTVYADGRCEPCYRYKARRRRERPRHLWVA